jgi:hypothetical protein
MFKETSLLLDVIIGRFPQDRVLRKGKHAVFQRHHTSKTLLCFSCFYIISCGSRYGRTRHNNVRCFCLSSYHTMSSPTCTKETCGCWGKKDTEDFRHYVDEGFIDIDNCVAGYIESVRVDPRCRRFATRSKLSFRDNYKNITADLRLERELRGGRASKFFVFCLLCIVTYPTH